MEKAQSERWWWAGQDNSFNPLHQDTCQPLGTSVGGLLHTSVLPLPSINVNHTLLTSGVPIRLFHKDKDVIMTILEESERAEPERRSSSSFELDPFKISYSLERAGILSATLLYANMVRVCVYPFWLQVPLKGHECNCRLGHTKYPGYVIRAPGPLRQGSQKRERGPRCLLPTLVVPESGGHGSWVAPCCGCERSFKEQTSLHPHPGAGTNAGCESCLNVCSFRHFAAWHISSSIDLNSIFAVPAGHSQEADSTLKTEML